MVTTGRTESKVENVWAERDQWIPRGVATYTHVVVDHAHGAEVWDVEGRCYIDFAGGIGSLNVGHTPEPVVEAIRDQAGKLIHSCFSVAIYEPYVELARRLAQAMPGDFAKKAMFVNSGAETVENAIKIARAATGRPNIISFHNAFHGRTLLGMSLTGKERPYREGFGPFTPEVHHAEFPYSYRCPDENCRHHGGTNDCPIESGAALERLLADEVQTGFGRTGHMFAMEASGVVPDITALAKALGGGLPLGAIVGRAEIMDHPMPGGIGGTYGGNPIACRAALAVLDLFEQQN